MNLRHKFIIYLAGLHLVCGAAFVYLLRSEAAWLLAIEVSCIVSFIIAYRLFAGFFTPLQLIVESAEFLKERDFTSFLKLVGQPETDTLISVYNAMIASLREERLRLQEQEYLLSTIIAASPAGIIILGFDGQITNMNPSVEAMFDVHMPTMFGKTLMESNLPFAESISRMNMSAADVLTHGVRRFKVQKAQFMDRGFPRTFVMIEELTDELRASEKAAYERVIRLLAHEVNNSVGATTSLLSSCLRYAPHISTNEASDDRADFEMALHVAIKRSEQLAAFMKRYAEVVKLPAPTKQQCDVQQLLENIVMLFREQCREQKITVQWQIESALEDVFMDKAQMEHVFINLIKNAVEAIGEEGIITIRLGNRPFEKHNREPFVCIEDTGSGFSPEVQAQLLTPFFSTKEQGQGIGLTFTQEVCAAHKFSFHVESTSNEPTRCWVLF